MKKLERMAEEYAEKENYGGGEPCANLYYGYMAGFQAARTMALETIDRFDADPVGRCWEVINVLGEEEEDNRVIRAAADALEAVLVRDGFLSKAPKAP
jgi:hypothetical protein